MSHLGSYPTHAALGRFHLTNALAQTNPQTLAACFRGAVASLFSENPAFHGHEGDRARPRYPEVHYRWVNGAPALFALGTAASHVMSHPWPGVVLRLGEEPCLIRQVDWSALAITRAFSRRLLRYELGAPWIALNQENYARYRGLSMTGRRYELDRILVGNLLTMSQAFGWFFESNETVYASFEPTGEVQATIKGVSLIGFMGSFVTNLSLPNGLAIGRSISHGFGWFCAQSNERPTTDRDPPTNANG